VERLLPTDERTARLSALSAQLEEQYQRYTEDLTGHTERLRLAADAATMAMISDCRQVLADTARALQRLAEGRYGICQECHRDIPIARLEILPQARHCGRCQRAARAEARVGTGIGLGTGMSTGTARAGM
jgi:RNA polymerase-binding transcription factor DksA